MLMKEAGQNPDNKLMIEAYNQAYRSELDNINHRLRIVQADDLVYGNDENPEVGLNQSIINSQHQVDVVQILNPVPMVVHQVAHDPINLRGIQVNGKEMLNVGNEGYEGKDAGKDDASKNNVTTGGNMDAVEFKKWFY